MTEPEFRDVTRLTRPFPQKVIKPNPSGGGTYVAHTVVEQRLLHTLGPPTTSMVEIIRGFVPGKPADPKAPSARGRAGTPDLANAVVGVVLRMSSQIDGVYVSTEEVGDCEDPHNWPHDGARLKDAFSDAYKRCAMRWGVGLHIWASKEGKFNLHDHLKAEDLEQVEDPEAEVETDEAPQDAEDVPEAPTSAPRSPRRSRPNREADPAAPASSPPDSVSHDDLPSMHPDRLCPRCGKKFGNHTLQKESVPCGDGSSVMAYVHRKCENAR